MVTCRDDTTFIENFHIIKYGKFEGLSLNKVDDEHNAVKYDKLDLGEGEIFCVDSQ